MTSLQGLGQIAHERLTLRAGSRSNQLILSWQSETVTLVFHDGQCSDISFATNVTLNRRRVH